MAGDDDIQSKFNLDVKEAIENALKAKTAIRDMSAAENLTGLVQGLISVAPMLAGIGVAAFALKKTFDLVFEGEQIKAVNIQFELLSKNAGLAGDSLKKALEKAADGLVDTTDLLQIANRAIVTMGASAAKLPEIMELARKVGVLTGKDVATAFEELTHAIETGNQRQLKNLGIIVDVEKATKKYAQTLGLLNTNELTDAGKKQAILNEVLEKGGKDLASIDPKIKEATNSWQQIKVTFKDVGEAIAISFEKVAGPTVKEFLAIVKQAAVQFKQAITDDYGAGVETLKHRNQEIIAQMIQLESNISDVQASVSTGLFTKDQADADIKNYRDQLNLLDMELKGVQAQIKSTKTEAEGWHPPMMRPGSTGEPQTNEEERLKNLAKYAAQRNEIEKQILQNKEKNILDERNIDDLVSAERLQVYKDYTAKKQQIDAEYSLNDDARTKLNTELYRKYQVDLTAFDIEEQNLRTSLLKKSFDNQEKLATGFFNKFAAGARKASSEAKIAFMDFSALGTSLVNKLGDNIAQAFQGIGEEGFVLGREMKKAIIGALADEAMARGALLIASSIWPPNPVGLAAGIGLEALSGVLRGLAGSGGGGGVSSGGGSSAQNQPRSGTNIGISESNEIRNAAAENASAAGTRRSVNITIQGHYFETEQTKTRLVEIIREAGDTTDFNINTIGGSI